MSEALLLARLLDYPEEDGLLAHLEEAQEMLQAAQFPEATRQGIASLIGWLACTDPLTIQETYVEMVDRSRRGSLHLFEHVHGESRERGAAMIDLREFYAQRGMELSSSELPDWLPAILEFSSTAPDGKERQFLSELAPVVGRIVAEHSRQGSLWTPVLDAVLHLCGGSSEASRALPPGAPEPHIDALWEEPMVEFAGSCATPGDQP